jgi:hypothetical protein
MTAPLGGKRLELLYARDVAARTGEAGHESRLDRIGDDAAHDDRDRAGSVLGSETRRRTGGHDDLDLQGNQLGSERG